MRLSQRREPSAIFGIFANDVQEGPRRADDGRLGVLRHQEHVASLPAADFVHKFGKGFAAGQIQGAARLAPVAVSAGDQRALPAFGQFDDFLVFLGTARGVEFKGVQKFGGLPQESLEDFRVLVLFRCRTGSTVDG